MSAWLRLSTLIVVFALVAGACSAATDQSAPKAGEFTIAMPLPEGDLVAAFREAEAKLRQEGRDKAELSKLGPGAPALVAFMDRAASFQLTQLPAKLKAQRAAATSGGRLAATRAGMPPDGAPVYGTYLTTMVVFNDLIVQSASEGSSGSKTASLDPDTDEVTVSGNKGTITTTTTVTVKLDRSKVSVDIKMKVAGEVRDAVSGAVLYKVSAEATGHADGDACPDTSGTARARMQFNGKEDKFDSTGAQTGSSVSEGFGGDIRFKVDDNAKLAGIDVSPNGQGAEVMLRIAASTAGPAFEKVWRSGTCIEVLVDPEGGEVDKESVTDVTAKVRHKIEGNELDKSVEAKLTSGVKQIDPAGSKVKSPAKFRFTAGPEAGDSGGVTFESVSNRGIGKTAVTFTVGGGWTISSVGDLTQIAATADGRVAHSARVSFNDVKVTAGKDNVLSGNGRITMKGSLDLNGGECTGEIDHSFPFTLEGTVAGTGPAAVLKVKINAPTPAGETFQMTCDGETGDAPFPGTGYIYGLHLGELELPTAGGTKSFDRRDNVAPAEFRSTATVTVVRNKR